MKILRTIETFYPYISGPANQAFMVSSNLEKMGISSPILTTTYGAAERPAEETIQNVHVCRYPVRFGFMKYLYSPKMKRMLRDFDIIHSHNYRSYQTEIAYMVAEKAGKPFVISTHGSLLGYKAFVRGANSIPYRAYDFVGKKIIKNASAVIVASKMEYGEAIKFGCRRETLHIIPMGIDINDYKPAKKTWERKETRLLFVGRISRDRNLEPVLKAMKLLAQNDKKSLKPKPKIQLTIVGEEQKRSATSKSGYVDELKAHVRELGIEKQVVFAGKKTGKELKEYYTHSDIFVYTSLWENFGQSILEAAAAGLPLICTNVGIAPDLIKEGKTGYLVGTHDPQSIARAVINLKGNSSASKKLRMAVDKGYNWQHVMGMYMKLYNAVLESENR
jgi:glycosyltransferase involved in cell wall biosynthesis